MNKTVFSYLQAERWQTKFKNYRGISPLNACYKPYSNIFSEKLKAQVEKFFLKCQNVFRNGKSCIAGMFSINLLTEKGREFNLETHLEFLDNVKAFDKSFET
jgi:hypothetical protein